MGNDDRSSNEQLAQLYDEALQCYGLGRFEQALTLFDAILGECPANAPVHVSRGAALLALSRIDEALASFDQALIFDPNHASAAYSKGVALQSSGRLQEALDCYSLAVSLNYALETAHNNKALVLRELGRIQESIGSYDHAIALNPASPDFRYGQAMNLLLLGRFEQGWKLYEWRKKMASWQCWGPRVNSPAWTGSEPLEGKTLLIQAEQGLGDTIQFCRYAPVIEKLGATVILSVQRKLARLLTTLGSQIIVKASDETVPRHDYHISLLSLPLALDCRGCSIPNAVPYLRPEPDRKEFWQRRLKKSSINIGICWQGDIRSDNSRAFPLRYLERIAKMSGVRLISLQKNDGVEQLRSLSAEMQLEVLEGIDEGHDAFVDTAAIMENLDLIITSDTAIAHLAGALARPTWLALRHVPEWRWLLKETRSAWYPTIRLFRQAFPGDWQGVFASMESELKKWHSPAAQNSRARHV